MRYLHKKNPDPKEKKRKFIFLTGMLCLLLLGCGGCRVWTKTDCSFPVTTCVNREIIKCAWKTNFTGMIYMEERQRLSFFDWILLQTDIWFPAEYMWSVQEKDTLAVEDEDTYEQILKKQEADENEVKEDGALKKNDGKIAKIKESRSVTVSEKKLKDYAYLRSHFYTVDQTTTTNAKELNAGKLLKKNMKIKKAGEKPKILIYHTHSQETFRNSDAGDPKTSIVGMGSVLAKELNQKYQIPTIHHKGVYDLVDGKMDRSHAYQLAEEQVKKILKKYPSIEVVIDLHRDGVGENTHLVTNINGKATGQIMFFNGLSRTKKNGAIPYLKNPYIQDNLAFSMQMQLEAAKKYPGFTRKIYLKSYRYNMHLMPKYLLIEAGAQTNTVEEMKRSMKILASLLDAVLDPEKSAKDV